MRNLLEAMSPKESWHLLIQEPSDANSSSYSHAGVWQALSCASHVLVTTAAVTWCMQHPCDVQTSAFPSSLPHLPALLSFLPEPWMGDVHMNDAPAVEHSELFTLHTSDSLLILALTMTHYKKKLIWPKLRAAQICGHKHKYLECSLTSLSV